MRPNEKSILQFCTTVFGDLKEEPVEVLCDEVETVRGFVILEIG